MPNTHIDAYMQLNISTELPQGCSITAVTAHGSSFWTQTAKLEIKLADETPKSYFLKASLPFCY
jgi:protein-ribulosamine 3-kinase